MDAEGVNVVVTDRLPLFGNWARLRIPGSRLGLFYNAAVFDPEVFDTSDDVGLVALRVRWEDVPYLPLRNVAL